MNRRKLGVGLITAGVLSYLLLGIAQIAFDYPLLLVLATAAIIAGVVMVLLSFFNHRRGSNVLP